MKKLLLLCLPILLSSCLTLTGTYRVKVMDENGKDLAPHLNIIAQGSGIYTTKNALCRVYPRGIIHYIDIETGKELAFESPSKCYWF